MPPSCRRVYMLEQLFKIIFYCFCQISCCDSFPPTTEQGNMTGVRETPASIPASIVTTSSKDTVNNQPEAWLKPDSIFYNPTRPNNVGLPAPHRTQLPRNEQIPFRRYNPQTGKVTLEPYPPSNLYPVFRLSIDRQKY